MAGTGEVKMSRLLILLMTVALLGGCAAKKLIIRNADTLLANQVEKRLPLHSHQQRQLRSDLKRFLNEKKAVARDVMTLIDDINPDAPAKVEDQYQKLSDHYKQVALDFSRLLSRYIAQLDQRQQRQFFSTLETENRDLEKKKSSARRKQLEERLIKVFGKLTEEQRKLIDSEQEHFDRQFRVRLERRRELQSKIRGILQGAETEAARSDAIYQAFVDFHEESIAKSRNLQLLQKFLPTLDASQKSSLQGRLQEVKEMLSYYLETSY
jgi:hypothetical protein